MAVRVFQLSLVFAIGFYLATATLHALASEGLTKIPLSLHLEDPKDVIVARGQSASLTCGIRTKSTQLHLRWQYNNKPIDLSDTRWQVLENGTLYIPKVAGKSVSSVEGLYQCLVKNEFGALLSNPAKLKIATIGRNFLDEPANVTVSEGQPIVLPCNIHSFPSAIVTWERNDLPLPHTTRYVPLPTGALLITSTHSSDVGSYRCKIVNQILTKTKYSKAGQLTVFSIPTVVSPPELLPLNISRNITALVGENLTLYCVFKGWPIPVIKWIKNTTVVGNSSVLILPNVTTKDSGDYVCSSHNSVYTKSQIFHVEILQPPYFNVTPVSKEYPSSRTLRLNCEASGIPTPKIYWLINGTVLKLDGRMKKDPSGLVMSHSFSTDTGLYQCVAENSVGKKWAAAQLVSKFTSTRPLPPVNVQCRPYNDTSICLQWDAPQNSSAQAYSIYSYHAEMGPEYVTNITNQLAYNLNRSTNYTFYVRFYSKKASDQSELVTCETGTNGERNLKVQIYTESSVELTWSEISSDISCNGSLGDYRVQWKVASQPNINIDYVSERKFIVRGLDRLKLYEFRVTSATYKNENSSWVLFNLPLERINPIRNKEEFLDYNETDLTAPYSLEAESLSFNSINLTWSSIGDYYNRFSICYVEVKSFKKCEDEEHKLSTSNYIKITNLKPSTSYELKVRGNTKDGNYSPYSRAIEVRTQSEGPADIEDLRYRIINLTAVCLKWRAPYHKNGKYIRYIISYTHNSNLPLEKWNSLNITASQWKYKACWLDQGALSVMLNNLDSDIEYTAIIKAENSSFVNPSTSIHISTKVVYPEYSEDDRDLKYKQKLGFILGIGISLVCGMCCISCLLFRRECLKRRALSRARLAASTNYYTGGVISSPCTSLQFRNQESCTADMQEMQNLIGQNGVSNIPVLAPHLDTKGGVCFPNNQTNGSPKIHGKNGFISNGHVHITENPRFSLSEYNGHINSKLLPENNLVLLPMMDDSYEEDTNSNLPNTKLHQFILQDQSISGNKKKLNSKSHNSDSSTVSADSSLNTTQLTNLDDSISVLPTPYRKISAPLGPNG